ncbi:beta-ketoacyl synthase N-terminal-like domain-containing protein [Desulfosarcina sp.]|uniref:beta-ketoacyl synthase N-terminal-like domain-containing protein n=1 Tax=Desulfosarcina sp. TaxID=2027861 RepID=UPI003970D2E0
MKVVICGIGVVGGFGSGLPALEKALDGNRVAATQVPILTHQGPIQVPCLTADTSPLADYVPTRVLRRMDHYNRLGLLAAFEAMADAELLDKSRRGRMGIIVATGNGATGNNYDFQYPFEDKEEICGSPIRFSNSVHNAAAAYISIALGEMGPNHSITHEDLSFPSALMTGVTWLQQQRVDAVLVGGVDQLSHAHAYAWHVHRQTQDTLKKIDPTEMPAPLAGEGACFFVLKAADTVSTPYALIHETSLGRICAEPRQRPMGDIYFLAEGGLAATRADYGKWLLPGARTACYSHVYGDLAIDSAFNTAIAALSRRKNRIYPGSGSAQPVPARELPADRSIVCLKLGVGNTYAWTILN